MATKVDLAHAPLFKQNTLDGQVCIECACGFRTAPQDDFDAACDALGRHIFPAGE